MTVYCYYRVSSDKQDYENQKSGVLKWCENKGFQIDDEILDDGISGTKEPEQRKLGRILKKIKKGDVIICSELSRLGRRLFMVMRILEHCMKVGAKVYTVKDGYELGDNIQSKVLAFAFSLAAEIERDMISLRTKEALARKKAEGVILGRPKGRLSSYLKLSKKDAKLRKLWDMGYSKSKIGRMLGVHRLTVAKYIKRYINEDKGNLAGMSCSAAPAPACGNERLSRSRSRVGC